MREGERKMKGRNFLQRKTIFSAGKFLTFFDIKIIVSDSEPTSSQLINYQTLKTI